MVEKIFVVQVDDFDDGDEGDDDDDFVLCAERIRLHQNNHLKQHCEDNYLKKILLEFQNFYSLISLLKSNSNY